MTTLAKHAKHLRTPALTIKLDGGNLFEGSPEQLEDAFGSFGPEFEEALYTVLDCLALIGNGDPNSLPDVEITYR